MTGERQRPGGRGAGRKARPTAGEWAGEMTRGEPVPFDTSVAHVARVYNYWLGGKDNFAADRAAGDQAIRVFPDTGLSSRSNPTSLPRQGRFLSWKPSPPHCLSFAFAVPPS